MLSTYEVKKWEYIFFLRTKVGIYFVMTCCSQYVAHHNEALTSQRSSLTSEIHCII